MAQLLFIPGIIIAVLGFLAYQRYVAKKHTLPLPPGPRPVPLLGNVLDFPPKGVPEHQHWVKHKDTYGPISSLTALGTTIIIIHDREAVRFLMETNALESSVRPRTEFGSAMCGFEKSIFMQPCNESFRQSRKDLHQQMGSRAIVSQFHDDQEVESRRFLLNILNDPQHLEQHIRTRMAAGILKITYGYSIQPRGVDPLVALIERMVYNLALAFVPLAWPVDLIPALKYIPEGLPGAGFKKTARLWKKVNNLTADIPYDFVQRQMLANSHQPSYVSRVLERRSGGSFEPSKLTAQEEDDLKWTAATMYAGGGDTMVGTVRAFVLAMILFPDVQRKAQEEIDRVVGINKLPVAEDRDRLPYIEGVVKEALRWNPIISMGIGHMTEEDMVYDGYLIPKGAVLLPTVWWFCHDPDVHSDPESFDPTRYLAPRNERDPADVVFGFGRRICPGRFLAESGVFITIAQMLATFHIDHALDDNGQKIEVKLDVTPSVLARPKEFAYSLVPRSASHAELVRRIEVERPWGEGDADLLEGAVEAIQLAVS